MVLVAVVITAHCAVVAIGSAVVVTVVGGMGSVIHVFVASE